MSRLAVNNERSSIGDEGRDALGRLRVVLVGVTHPGNIGAAARAMKAMGIGRLYLVGPKVFPSAEATARAAGADDVLGTAMVCTSLAAALAGATLAIAATARARRLEWPVWTPREAAAWVAGHPEEGDVALVFGSEKHGLSNAHLDLCQRIVRIPTRATFASLNLAQAVQICVYEMHLALALNSGRTGTSAPAVDPLAGTGQLDELFRYALGVMQAVGYLDPARPKLLARRLRRMIARSGLLVSDVQILRGFLGAVRRVIEPEDG